MSEIKGTKEESNDEAQTLFRRNLEALKSCPLFSNILFLSNEVCYNFLTMQADHIKPKHPAFLFAPESSKTMCTTSLIPPVVHVIWFPYTVKVHLGSMVSSLEDGAMVGWLPCQLHASFYIWCSRNTTTMLYLTDALKNLCSIPTVFIMYHQLIGICFPFFGALLGFFGGFAFAPTSYYLPCIIWLLIYKPRRFSLSWITNWICIFAHRPSERSSL